MRVAAILACAITVVLGNDIDVEIDIEVNAIGCPLDATITKFFPHDTYCDKFYQCSNGLMVERKCSKTTLFNVITLECDWNYNVDCGGRNISESSPEQNASEENDEEDDVTCNCDPSEAPEICAQSESDGILVAHEYCTRFYKCSGGQPITIRCPKTLYFNPYKKRCDWAEDVDCGNRTIPETDDDDSGSNDNNENDDDLEIDGPINEDPAKASEICAQDNSNGILIANEYCNWYSMCDNGKPVSLKCPTNLVWNPRRERCDWPGKVDCGNKTISEPEDDGSDGNGNNNENDDDQEIDFPVNDDPAKASEICAQDNSNGILIANEYCNWYSMCDNGKPVSLKCPTNLVWNPRRERCDWPGKVDCGNKTISEPEDDGSDGNGNNNENDDDQEIDFPVNDDPAKASEICAQDNSNGILIANEYCNWYSMCDNGKPVSRKCPTDLVWNPRKKRCDWPGNVDCGDRVIPERNDTQAEDDSEDSCNNCDPSEAPEICAREGSDGVVVAHENCNQYYKCYAGKPNALRCINTFMFNPNKGWCDWPEQVDCGDRIIPDNEDSGNDNPEKASEICARPGSEGVLVAHENCSQFYKCSHGEPMELECQSGLQYNPLMGLCDWPHNVDCGDRQQ